MRRRASRVLGFFLSLGFFGISEISLRPFRLLVSGLRRFGIYCKGFWAKVGMQGVEKGSQKRWEGPTSHKTYRTLCKARRKFSDSRQNSLAVALLGVPAATFTTMSDE